MAGEGLAEPEAEVVASLGDGEEEVAVSMFCFRFFVVSVVFKFHEVELVITSAW